MRAAWVEAARTERHCQRNSRAEHPAHQHGHDQRQQVRCFGARAGPGATHGLHGRAEGQHLADLRHRLGQGRCAAEQATRGAQCEERHGPDRHRRVGCWGEGGDQHAHRVHRRGGQGEHAQRAQHVAREAEVAGGWANREIAEVLSLAEGTVKNHVSSVLLKLGTRDRTRAVLRALHAGLLEPGQA
ncbi:helix-turn-helix transcriptional regulator [Saccharomonospora piscinae]|uniref:helix-turn-helix transcriptional regulator n=1 Tax=Saccharomonospora piscinae TaxID=687388 RepID=UPI001FD96004|nr:LuxR C-terminal-related transcriptional regulator [Saccharomonospora piscinae]